MARTEYMRLIDRGRKAGLRTADLYRAMQGRRPEVSDQLDGNGFVSRYGQEGQRIYLPLDQEATR